jgi:hypothetical protein
MHSAAGKKKVLSGANNQKCLDLVTYLSVGLPVLKDGFANASRVIQSMVSVVMKFYSTIPSLMAKDWGLVLWNLASLGYVRGGG